MKNLHHLLILALIIVSGIVSAQEITGQWNGQLAVQGQKLRISFHISEDGGKYTSTMDSPDQGAMGIPTEETTFEDNTLTISMKSMGIEYSGKLVDREIQGTFSQAGMQIPMNLTREIIEEEKAKARPQDPVEPLPYLSEDVYFINKKANGIKLAGTLTLPKGVKNPPVVVMITGSGPQNRDEEVKMFNHRPFLVWSDYLTRHGIAVLRYDDRGVAQSEGSQEGATSADFATDVEAAVAYLKTRKDVNTNKIGLIGHSEGGYIAPMVAANNQDIAFIVLLAGTGVDGGIVLASQTRKSGELHGATKKELDFNDQGRKGIHQIIRQETDLEVIKTKIIAYLHELRKTADEEQRADLTDELIEKTASTYATPWLTYFIRTNPDQFLSQVKCPVLAINGDKDTQVLADLNLNGIEQSLKKANNKDVTIVKLEGMNHLFQTCETGSTSEYGQIEETVSPKALQVVEQWISKVSQ